MLPTTEPPVRGLLELADDVAIGCQILAETGLTPNVLGHISVRVGPGRALVRCRGPRERGLAFTTADDIRQVPICGAAGELGDLGAWTAPNELPLHTAILQAQPDVTAVVHAHPPAVVTMALAGLPWLPIIGAYDIPAARIAAAGIPVWPRAVLVNTPQLGDDLAACVGDRPVGVLYGHGLVSTGRGAPEHAIAEAVTNAVAIDSLARLTLAVRMAGSAPAAIPDEDLAQLPDLGGWLNVETMWRHLAARVAARHGQNSAHSPSRQGAI
jgi:ribulose-5-phosphate 4-epimerase/fuculose-1-phosphate aldolase